MGWSSGSGLLEEVWEELRDFVAADDRAGVLATLMEIFSGRDCDTLDELTYREDWPEAREAWRLFARDRDGEGGGEEEEDGEE